MLACSAQCDPPVAAGEAAPASWHGVRGLLQSLGAGSAADSPVLVQLEGALSAEDSSALSFLDEVFVKQVPTVYSPLWSLGCYGQVYAALAAHTPYVEVTVTGELPPSTKPVLPPAFAAAFSAATVALHTFDMLSLASWGSCGDVQGSPLQCALQRAACELVPYPAPAMGGSPGAGSQPALPSPPRDPARILWAQGVGLRYPIVELDRVFALGLAVLLDLPADDRRRLAGPGWLSEDGQHTAFFAGFLRLHGVTSCLELVVRILGILANQLHLPEARAARSARAGCAAPAPTGPESDPLRA